MVWPLLVAGAVTLILSVDKIALGDKMKTLKIVEAAL